MKRSVDAERLLVDEAPRHDLRRAASFFGSARSARPRGTRRPGTCPRARRPRSGCTAAGSPSRAGTRSRARPRSGGSAARSCSGSSRSARSPRALETPRALGEPVGGLVAAADVAHLAGLHRAVERLHHLVAGQIRDRASGSGTGRCSRCSSRVRLASTARRHVVSVERGAPAAHRGAEPAAARPGDLGRDEERLARAALLEPAADDLLAAAPTTCGSGGTG